MAGDVFDYRRGVGWSGVSLPEGNGKKMIESACVSCHGLEVLAHKQWNRERWQTVVTAMVARGAPVKSSDVSEVVGYLEKNFGEDRGTEAGRRYLQFVS